MAGTEGSEPVKPVLLLDLFFHLFLSSLALLIWVSSADIYFCVIQHRLMSRAKTRGLNSLGLAVENACSSSGYVS